MMTREVCAPSFCPACELRAEDRPLAPHTGRFLDCPEHQRRYLRYIYSDPPSPVEWHHRQSLRLRLREERIC